MPSVATISPFQARYDELGENSRGGRRQCRHPESVLALVQPAIMMTEEGAMEQRYRKSDAGTNRRRLGMEGPMEEGVGSLMMANQPAPPPMPTGPPNHASRTATDGTRSHGPRTNP